MRIAHVTATYPPYSSGTAYVCYHNAFELANLGHEVHVFTALRDNRPKLEKCNGITIHRLSPVWAIGNAPLIPQLLWKLKGFDIVHLHYPFIFGAELVRIVTTSTRTPMVITFHNDLIGNGARASVFRWYQRFSSWFTVRNASRLCSVSMDHYKHSRLRTDLKRHEPLVTEMPNGVDVALFLPEVKTKVREIYKIPEPIKLMLFVATLDRAHHFKGLAILIRALQTLPEDTYLMVVGDGDLRDGYQHLSQELQVDSRCIFVGDVPNIELPPYFSAANITILPSSPPESFGMVLIESLACGTPIIASDIPGVRTVVDDGVDGYLFRLGDTDDLAQKITKLLSSQEKSQAMGKAGRQKVVDKYAWESIGKRLEHLYSEILS